MNTGKVVFGIVASLAVGTMVGLLFAPEKGSRLRRRFMDKGEDYADSLKSKFEEFVDNVSTKYESAMQEVESIVGKATMKYDDAKKDHKSLEVNPKG
jgi:gas vesicle protein